MFKVGQKVWCAIYGAGVVTEVDGESAIEDYNVVVRFTDEHVAIYTAEGKYHAKSYVTLFPYPVEITKAAVKLSIDWNHVNENFRYLAMDADGRYHLYTDKPLQGDRQWVTNPPCTPAIHFASFTFGTCNWKDSLVERPN